MSIFDFLPLALVILFHIQYSEIYFKSRGGLKWYWSEKNTKPVLIISKYFLVLATASSLIFLVEHLQVAAMVAMCLSLIVHAVLVAFD